jgi:hypothetical protein
MRIPTSFLWWAATFIVASSVLSVSVVAFQSSSLSFQTTNAGQSLSSKRIVATQLHESKISEFQIELDMPPSGSVVKARLKFGSVLSVPSEIVEVRYKLPFGLDVAPLKNLAVCTKDGPGGGTSQE